MRVHNPTNNAQKIGFAVRDGDKKVWARMEQFAPGETRVIAVTTDDLQSRILISDIKMVTLCSKQPTAEQSFLISPVYLIKR